MNYQSYVVSAYMVFVVVLGWDFLAPRLRTAHLLRSTRQLQARKAAATAAARNGELQR